MRHPIARRAVAAIAIAATAGLVAACTPEPSTPGNVKQVTNATFEWTISREADNGTPAPGQVNYWSAGQSDSTAATYVATNGNATVLKKNAAGTYVPIASESAVSWANKNRNGNGNLVNSSNAFYLGQKVRYTNGTGTVNPDTGVASIQWTGTFTVNFYGTLVPFWIVNPRLTVDATGFGRLTASVGGFASSQDDPDVRTPLPLTPNVVLAELPNVYSTGSIATGFSAALPNYLNKSVTVPAGGVAQVAKTPGNAAYWGAWPQSFTSFQQQTGLGAYWYTSGGANDAQKPQEPVKVTYTLNP